ncbi:hypothetical protein SUGI_0314160 [Cryptomeria japonica]|nr:hypothetical protein SUGI_0314160 [Cryptomeria japonica]
MVLWKARKSSTASKMAVGERNGRKNQRDNTMDRGSAAGIILFPSDSRLIRSASVVESARKVFYCFQNGARREKRKKEPERSSVLKVRNWTSLFRYKRSTHKKIAANIPACLNIQARYCSVQEEEVGPGSGADSRIRRSAIVVESASCRWKPIETQKRRSVSIFASGTRNPSFEQINRISAELKPHGVVEVYSGACRNYFFCSPARLFSLLCSVGFHKQSLNEDILNKKM